MQGGECRSFPGVSGSNSKRIGLAQLFLGLKPFGGKDNIYRE